MKIEHESRFEIDFCPRLIFLLVEEELLVEKDLFRDSWIVVEAPRPSDGLGSTAEHTQVL